MNFGQTLGMPPGWMFTLILSEPVRVFARMDWITLYHILTERSRPPGQQSPLGLIGWTTIGLLALTVALILVRIVWR